MDRLDAVCELRAMTGEARTRRDFDEGDFYMVLADTAAVADDANARQLYRAGRSWWWESLNARNAAIWQRATKAMNRLADTLSGY